MTPGQQQTSDSFAAALQSELRMALTPAELANVFSARNICLKLGIHQRTLHRRLRAEGTRYRIELARVRLQLAERLLTETDWRLIDLALALGYAESSSFVRAFKRWTGVTPSRFRHGARIAAAARLQQPAGGRMS